MAVYDIYQRGEGVKFNEPFMEIKQVYIYTVALDIEKLFIWLK